LFASHIGIFGNTGSGKSNTLHKLFLELFRSKYYENIIKKSQFFIIDFNGEYIRENMFEVKEGDKEIFEINTRSEKQGRKLPIKRDYLFDVYIVDILFESRQGNHLPFLKNSLEKYKEKITNADSFASIEIGLLI